MKFKSPGMRNVKTAISVAICVGLSQLFNREYIFYAAIAAVIAMQSSVSDSFKAGKNRMLGTVIGAIVGFLCALINPGNTFLCGIGVIFVIYICDILGWKKSVTISCIVFLAIMLNLGDRTPLSYSVNRIIDTFIGITVAVFVNYLISPPKHTDNIKEECILTVDKVFIIVEDIICKRKDVKLNDLSKEIDNFQSALNIYLSEFRMNQQKSLEIEKVKEMLNLCKGVYIHLNIIQSLKKEYSLNEQNYIRLVKLFGNDITYKNANDDMSIVFNYHVTKIIEEVSRIKEVEV